jgi:uncharacterized protein
MDVERMADSLRRFVRPLYADQDPAHDFDHVERILARLDDLSQGVDPPPRPELLAFLGCFHGLNQRLREDQGLVEEVRSYLTEKGWEGGAIEEALAALDRHVADPRTVEEKIVHDANALETLGAFGVAKAFTTGGARGQTYEETASIFERRLAQATFHTPRGLDLAEEGRAYAAAFLRRLEAEL